MAANSSFSSLLLTRKLAGQGLCFQWKSVCFGSPGELGGHRWAGALRVGTQRRDLETRWLALREGNRAPLYSVVVSLIRFFYPKPLATGLGWTM